MLTVYTTKTCAFCPLVKNYLSMKKADYKEVDVSNDIDTRSELLKLTGMQTVPITTDGNRFVVGWKPAELATLIA
jgi:glutaredoxin